MKVPDHASRTAEDHHLRSRWMRELIQTPDRANAPRGATRIPKMIVQYWHDLSAVPADVRECVDSWEQFTKHGFGRLLFGDGDARCFIDAELGGQYTAAFDVCRHPAMRCDYFRLCYMVRRGGFYVDADDVYIGRYCESWFDDDRLKVQALCYDNASGTMVRSDEFAAAGADSQDWIFYANNNPLIAPAAHPVLCLALERATGILLSHPNASDIQSTTGPGNLTASLVRHSVASERAGKSRDFVIMANWEAVAVSRWPLSYRTDERNWRLWRPG
jgi:mannosyltransferase OCH1-like enzyme